MAATRLTIDRWVGWLEFNRPPVNAFTREMVDEVHDTLAGALADDMRVGRAAQLAHHSPEATTQRLQAFVGEFAGC